MSVVEALLIRCVHWAEVISGPAGAGRLSILIFHRVLPQPDPLLPGEVDVGRFDALVRMLAGAFRVLPLGRALDMHERNQLPRRALSITFDDGYADNAGRALPVLQRYGVQATFFVATGFLDGGRMFNDSVIECIRSARQPLIDLEAYGLGVQRLASDEDRRRVIDLLLPKVKYLGLDERETWLGRLIDLAGRPELPNDLMMSAAQVLALHRAGMEIGAHTVHHPILRLMDDMQAEREISEGAARLRQITGEAPSLFAYPNGKPMQDYDARHVALVKRLGFRAAVSTAAGTVDARSDFFQLPRYTPWDHTNPKWMARLVRERLRRTRAAASAA